MDRLDATRGRRTIARPGTGERPVGPPDHSPGRNPGAQRHTPPTNRAARPEWMYRPARIRPHRVPAPPRGSPRSSTRQGFAPPGFRPGLWSTGPTARPGTGERPVGAPDHSQGRNPWAAKPPGGTDTAPPRRGECTPPAKFAGVRRRPGNSVAGAAGSKVTLATRLPRPLGQK